ncbi:NAD(P)-binding protein [Dentipellis sp. KUC8613]|nr:NAD(P)-binding protein [Dentipellis sp. KUC8613]
MSFAADLFSAAGRVAVITGGGTGLGLWMAEAWVKNSGKVYITGRREETLKAAVVKLNGISKGSASYVKADVSVQADINKLASELSAREKAIDVLVNNAGTPGYDAKSPDAPLATFDQAAWVKQFTVNAWAPAAVTSALASLLIEAAKKGEGRGSVILIGSVAQDFWSYSWPSNGYSVSKAAEAALTKTLATKLIVHGVRVNTIKPGTFPTAMNDPSVPGSGAHEDSVRRNVPLNRNGTADDITPIFLFFATKAGAYVTGQEIAVDGGWTLVANGVEPAGGASAYI